MVIGYSRFGLSYCNVESTSESLQHYGNRFIGFSICLPVGWERDYSSNVDLGHLGDPGIYANFKKGNKMIILNQIFPREGSYIESDVSDINSFSTKYKSDRKEQIDAVFIMDETIILQQGTEAKILAYQWGRHNDIVSLVLLVINGDTAVELYTSSSPLEEWESLKDTLVSSFSTLRIY
jgi:hypothetical protein